MHFRDEDRSWTQSFLMQHFLTPSSGDESLDQWASTRKLVPWVALAAPIDSQRTNFQGKLFSTLSLPVLTHHPSHIHGLFAIPPDRARLSIGDMESRWNGFLFQYCVARCWTVLLNHGLAISLGEEAFSLWPRLYPTYQIEDLWTGLLNWVLNIIIKEDLAIWNSINTSPTTFNQALFACQGSESFTYRASWEALKVPIVLLEPGMYDTMVKEAHILSMSPTVLTPNLVRHHLPKVNCLSKDHAPMVLEYALSDFIRGGESFSNLRPALLELAEASIWPTLEGTLQSRKGARRLLLPRNEWESLLFYTCRPEVTLQLDRLTEPVLWFLRTYVIPTDILIRYRSLTDLEVDWPCLLPLATGSSNGPLVEYKPADKPLLSKIWHWISERCNHDHETLQKCASSIYLLPVHGQRIRKLAAEDPLVSTLVMQVSHPLSSIFLTQIRAHPHAEVAIVDTEVLGTDATALIAVLGQTSNWQLAMPDELTSLVEWLYAARSLVEALSALDKVSLITHLSALANKSDLNPNSTANLRALPLFSRSVVSGKPASRVVLKTAINESTTNYSIPPGLPIIPDIPGLALYDMSDSAERDLVKKLRLIATDNLEALLNTFILPFIQTSNDHETILALIDWVFRQVMRTPGPSWARLLRRWPVVPVASRTAELTLAVLSRVIDPESRFATMYFDDEGVFPYSDFFTKHRLALKTLGMSTGSDLPDMLLGRARAFSQHQFDIELFNRVACFLTVPVAGQSLTTDIKELRQIQWLPAIDPEGHPKMFAPDNCRGPDQAGLVDKIWGNIGVIPNSEWRELLGWNTAIPSDILLKQLQICIELHETSNVDYVISYLERHDISYLRGTKCILGAAGEYIGAERAFWPGAAIEKYPLSPYLDSVDRMFASKHPRLLEHMAIKKEPLLEDLKNVQAELSESGPGYLKSKEVATAIASLEVAIHLELDHLQLLVPDTRAKLREWTDIVHGEYVSATKALAMNFVHPRISQYLIDQLQIEHCDERALRLNVELDEDDDDEFAPHERPTTVINDTLGRYPIESTFNEFLANADDAGANSIHWIIDERSHKSDVNQTSLTTELKSLNGPALCIYNDGIFSSKDFEGFKDIGQGGKKDIAESIGVFGRGVQTMYHFTNVPMLISGEFLVLLDPQQRYLTRRRRQPKRKLGQRLPLSVAQQVARSQLNLFDGLQGFQADMNSFQGTIFRLPLYDPFEPTELRDNNQHMDCKRLESLLRDYLSTARLSLLFLNSVQSIRVSHQNQETATRWSVSISRPEGWMEEVFHDALLSVEKEGLVVRYDKWRLGQSDITESPFNVKKPGKASTKVTECGIAACLHFNSCAKEEPSRGSTNTILSIGMTEVENRLFSKLPVVNISDLPISLHASFAITGDRKTIAIDGDNVFAEWNRWLLTKPVTDLFVDFLKDCATRYGPAAFNFWPLVPKGTTMTVPKLIVDSLYSKVFSEQYQYEQLFPLVKVNAVVDDHTKNNLRRKMTRVGRSLHKASSVANAQFDTLVSKKSELLQPLYIKLPVSVVRPPIALWGSIKKFARNVHIAELGPETLSIVMKDKGNTDILQQHLGSISDKKGQLDFYRTFLDILVPSKQKPDVAEYRSLQGCHIIPRPDLHLPLGRLDFELEESTTWHILLDDPTPRALAFANDTFVHNGLFTPSVSVSDIPTKTLNDPITTLVEAGANIRKLKIDDIGNLLARPNSPLLTLRQSNEHDVWLQGLWSYLNSKFYPRETCRTSQGTDLINALGAQNLCHMRLHKLVDSKDCITPKEFEEGGFFLQPTSEWQQKLCDEIPRLRLVDRNFVPAGFADLEDGLERKSSFARLVKAIGQAFSGNAEELQESLSVTLSPESCRVLRKLLKEYLAGFEDRIEIPHSAVLEALPIWPEIKTEESATSAAGFLAAKDAYFCKHGEMFGPWTADISCYVDPSMVSAYRHCIVKLGVSTIPVAEMWRRTEHYLPARLSSHDHIDKFLDLLKILAKNGVKTDHRIALDGNCNLRYAKDLFDDEQAIYARAFSWEENSRFLHPTLRIGVVRKYLIKVGLRSIDGKAGINGANFLECAKAINRHWNPNSHDKAFEDAAATISGYLQFEKKEFAHWYSKIWQELEAMRLFNTLRGLASQPAFRRNRMQSVAGDSFYCSFEEAVPQKYIALCWSQIKIIKNSPAPTVLERLPSRGVPRVHLVFEHLKYMISIYDSVDQAELSTYLKDIQECYDFLQKQSGTLDLPNIRSEKIWFNLDTAVTETIMKDQLLGCLYSASRLCLQAPCKLSVFPFVHDVMTNCWIFGRRHREDSTNKEIPSPV